MEEGTKRYYDINEVAEMMGCQASALRFWEKKFPHLRPKRDSRNRRRYTQSDIDVVKKIVYQRNEQKRTLEGTRQQLNQREVAHNLINRLKRVRAFLVEIQEGLDAKSTHS